MKPFKLGLTGSIGMGKSTTAGLFAEMGCFVWDADAAVHRLYSKQGAAVEPIGQAFPSAIEDGEVSREKLRNIVSEDPAALKRIEDIVHPLVAKDRNHFIDDHQRGILVFDIPLLFETDGQTAMDAVACVTVSEEEQERRVLSRGTLSKATFLAIKAKQLPNAEKLARSDYVILTDTLEHARAQVHDVVEHIKGRMHA